MILPHILPHAWGNISHRIEKRTLKTVLDVINLKGKGGNEMTTGQLKETLKDLPDDLEIRLSSETGVDQGEGTIMIDGWYRVTCGNEDYFAVQANEYMDSEQGGRV